MYKSLLFKLAGVSLRAYRYFDRWANTDTDFKPYSLNYSPNPKNPKIIHVIGNFIVGGSTQLVVDIVERTSDEFFHKVVVPQVRIPLAYQPVDIHSFSIEQLSELADFLRDENPALVHIHYFARKSDRYDWIPIWYQTVFRICSDLNLPVVQNVNVPTEPVIDPSVVHNVFVSEFVRDNFNTSFAENSVIYPGSNFSHFKNQADVSLPLNCIGMVYRLDDDKLRAESIDVFIEVVKRKPGTRCLIVGGGKLSELYKRRVRNERCAEQFEFTGFVPYESLPNWYRKMSVFVVPVYDESFGQVVPFAMSMGLRIAAYDTGALAEILGERASLAQTGDVQGLADIVLKQLDALQEHPMPDALIQQRAWSQFSVENMIRQYRSLYASVIDRNQ